MDHDDAARKPLQGQMGQDHLISTSFVSCQQCRVFSQIDFVIMLAVIVL